MTASDPAAARAEPISVKIPEAVRLSGLSRSRIYELMRSGDIVYGPYRFRLEFGDKVIPHVRG